MRRWEGSEEVLIVSTLLYGHFMSYLLGFWDMSGSGGYRDLLMAGLGGGVRKDNICVGVGGFAVATHSIFGSLGERYVS